MASGRIQRSGKSYQGSTVSLLWWLTQLASAPILRFRCIRSNPENRGLGHVARGHRCRWDFSVPPSSVLDFVFSSLKNTKLFCRFVTSQVL